MGYTKCTGDKCWMKHICYRYTWNGNEFSQAYFILKDTDPRNEACDLFIPDYAEFMDKQTPLKMTLKKETK